MCCCGGCDVRCYYLGRDSTGWHMLPLGEGCQLSLCNSSNLLTLVTSVFGMLYFGASALGRPACVQPMLQAVLGLQACVE